MSACSCEYSNCSTCGGLQRSCSCCHHACCNDCTSHNGTGCSSSSSLNSSSSPQEETLCSACPLCRLDEEERLRYAKPKVHMDFAASPVLLHLPLMMVASNANEGEGVAVHEPCRPPPPLQFLGLEERPPPPISTTHAAATRQEGLVNKVLEEGVEAARGRDEEVRARPTKATTVCQDEGSQTDTHGATISVASVDVSVESKPSAVDVAVVTTIIEREVGVSVEVQTDHLVLLDAQVAPPRGTVDETTLTSRIASPVVPVPVERGTAQEADCVDDSFNLLVNREELLRAALFEREVAVRELLIDVVFQLLDEAQLLAAVRSIVSALRRCEAEQVASRAQIEDEEHQNFASIASWAHSSAILCWREQQDANAKSAAEHEVSLLKLSHASLAAQLRAQQEVLEHKIVGERAAAMQWLLDRQANAVTPPAEGVNGGAMDNRRAKPISSGGSLLRSNTTGTSILDGVDLSIPVHVRFARADAAARASLGGPASK